MRTRRQASSALSANSCRYPVHDRAFLRPSRPVLVVDDTNEAPRDIAWWRPASKVTFSHHPTAIDLDYPMFVGRRTCECLPGPRKQIARSGKPFMRGIV
jgi:hypothetical protein